MEEARLQPGLLTPFRILIRYYGAQELAMQDQTLSALRTALGHLQRDKKSMEQRAEEAENTLDSERRWAKMATAEFETTKHALVEELDTARKALRDSEQEADTLRRWLLMLVVAD